MSREVTLNFDGFNYYCLIQESQNRRSNPIIMIGGAFQNMQSWVRYFDCYTRLSTVIIVDLPGTGKSDVLPSSFGIDFLVSSLFHLFQELGVKRAELIAASYGTPVGIIFADHYPELVSHLALIGTMKEFTPDMKNRVEHALVHLGNNEMCQFAEEALAILMNSNEHDRIRKFDAIHRILFKTIASLDPDARAKFMENTRRIIYHEKKDYVFDFGSPVLVFTGENDRFTRPEYCKEIAHLFKNSHFTTVHDSDHLCNLEQFEITNRLITTFLLDEELSTIPGCNKVESSA